MKSILQLFRMPGKTLFGVLLVALGMTLLCVSVGQYYSAMETRNNLDSQYTTVALPANVREYNPEAVNFGKFYGNFFRAQDEYSSITLDNIMEDYPKLVKDISNASHASAYSPGLVTDLPIDHPYYAKHYCDIHGTAPYDTAVLKVELTTLGEPEVSWEKTVALQDGTLTKIPIYQVAYEASILRGISLHEGFRGPEGWTISGYICNIDDLAKLEALELEVGQRYMLYVDDYRDRDWELRKNVSYRVPVFQQEIDRSLLREPENEEGLSVNGVPVEFLVYQLDHLYEGLHVNYHMTMDEVAQIENINYFMTVNEYDNDYERLPGQEQKLLNMDGSEIQLSWEAYESYYSHPTFVKLTGTAEEYLASEEAALWRTVMEETEINNSSVPVIGVEKLGYLADFARNLVRITHGRDFTDEELADGAKVCVISETLAQMNGLEVGDTLPLQFYDYDRNLSQHISVNLIGEATQNPSAFYYSRRLGFSSDLTEYTIVGIYRQDNVWADAEANPYSFTPNTVFVPDDAVLGGKIYKDCNLFQTLILRNGALDKFQELVNQKGMQDVFVYYDQGYSEIAASMESYDSTSRNTLFIALACWLVIGGLYLVIFPMMQKQDAHRMRSFGALYPDVAKHMLVSAAGIVIPGAVFGAAAGLVLWEQIMGALMAVADVNLALEAKPGVMILTAVIATITLLAPTAGIAGVFSLKYSDYIQRREEK